MGGGVVDGRGNARLRFVAERSTPAIRQGQPRTNLEMRFQPAHQSMITNVLDRVPTHAHAHGYYSASPSLARSDDSCPTPLTKDIRAQRHNHAVRRAQHSRRHGDRQMPTKAPSPRIHQLSQCHRTRDPGGQGDPRHPRQLCHPQASQGSSMVGAPSPLDISFRPDVLLLAECCRGLLRQAHQAPPETRRLLFGRGAAAGHQHLHRDP